MAADALTAVGMLTAQKIAAAHSVAAPSASHLRRNTISFAFPAVLFKNVIKTSLPHFSKATPHNCGARIALSGFSSIETKPQGILAGFPRIFVKSGGNIRKQGACLKLCGVALNRMCAERKT